MKDDKTFPDYKPKKLKDIPHLPLTLEEVKHYQKLIGDYEIDESWVYDPKLPIDIQHRWSKALYGFMYQIMCEWLEISKELPKIEAALLKELNTKKESAKLVKDIRTMIREKISE